MVPWIQEQEKKGKGLKVDLEGKMELIVSHL